MRTKIIRNSITFDIEDPEPKHTLPVTKVALVTRLGALWWVNQLELSSIICSSKNHCKRLDTTHGSGLQVANTDQPTVLHLLNWDMLDQSRNNRPGLGLADIDGLDVERVSVGVLLDLEDPADAKVDLPGLGGCGAHRGGGGLGSLDLLFLLLGVECGLGISLSSSGGGGGGSGLSDGGSTSSSSLLLGLLLLSLSILLVRLLGLFLILSNSGGDKLLLGSGLKLWQLQINGNRGQMAQSTSLLLDEIKPTGQVGALQLSIPGHGADLLVELGECPEIGVCDGVADNVGAGLEVVVQSLLKKGYERRGMCFVDVSGISYFCVWFACGVSQNDKRLEAHFCCKVVCSVCACDVVIWVYLGEGGDILLEALDPLLDLKKELKINGTRKKRDA